MYYVFDDINDFNQWHNAIMEQLGIPDGLGTLIYAEPIIHPENGSVICSVDERADMSNRISLTSEKMWEQGYKTRPQPTGLP
jgi:hypothetical protein